MKQVPDGITGSGGGDVFRTEAFAGRRFLVTGGSRGIGEATVKALVQLGASVAVVARDPQSLRRLTDACGPDADLLTFAADVADATAMSELLDRCVRRWNGHLHGLVNNAMSTQVGRIDQLEEEQFQSAWEVNALAAWRLTKMCLALFEASGGGSVVNVSSVMAHQTTSGHHAYASSKGALEAQTRNLAVELASRRIRVNTVIPGYIRTYEGHPCRDLPREQWSEAMRLHAEYIELLTAEGQPWPQHGRPEDCASAILYLLSDGATFITGASLVVDGGMFVDFRGLQDAKRRETANQLAALERRIAEAEQRERDAKLRGEGASR